MIEYDVTSSTWEEWTAYKTTAVLSLLQSVMIWALKNTGMVKHRPVKDSDFEVWSVSHN